MFATVLQSSSMATTHPRTQLELQAAESATAPPAMVSSLCCLSHTQPFSPHPLPTTLQGAERDYDLNRAAELKYGTLLELQKQLKGAEAMLVQAEQARGRGSGRVRIQQRRLPACGGVGKQLKQDVAEVLVNPSLPWADQPHAAQ